MQSFQTKCYFHISDKKNSNGHGYEGVTVSYSAELVHITDGAGSTIFTHSLADIKDVKLDRDIGIATELYVFLASGSDYVLQPNEENNDYITLYEQDIATMYGLLSNRGL